jgi:CRP/FNR family transcriptional regulator
MELKDLALFKGFSKEEFKELEPYFSLKRYRKKELIFNEGEPPDWFCIVTAGKVKMTKLSHDGKEIILEIIQSGGPFGGIAVLQGFPYPANAVAMENTDVCRVSRRNLLRLLDRFPELMSFMGAILGERMKNSHEMMKNIALERVESRIASLLLKLVDKTAVPYNPTDSGGSGGLLIDIKLTKQDIADMVGTTVETSIRTMSKFKREGLLDDAQGKVLILDRKGLQRYAA